MSLISQAHAADTPTPATPLPEPTVSGTTVPDASADAAVTPADARQGLTFNIGFILLLFVMFYILMVRPQQKRIKEQQAMIGGLAKGEKVITNGGIIGTISALPSEGEVELEISPGVKVTVLRYSVYKKYDPADYAPKKAK